jgi:hypothetical protein
MGWNPQSHGVFSFLTLSQDPRIKQLTLGLIAGY